jgi:formylglycine-generating enzyme required for sulfatase activity
VILAALSSRVAQALSAGEECALKPKDVFKECDKCPETVVVPAGSFAMGSPASEKDRKPDEGPQHSVTISKPFAVGRFAVTFDEWDACVADGGCSDYKPDDSWGSGRQPVAAGVVEQCEGLCGVAFAEDRQELPFTERS